MKIWRKKLKISQIFGSSPQNFEKFKKDFKYIFSLHFIKSSFNGPHENFFEHFCSNLVDRDWIIHDFRTRELGILAKIPLLVRFGLANQANFLYLNFQLGLLPISEQKMKIWKKKKKWKFLGQDLKFRKKINFSKIFFLWISFKIGVMSPINNFLNIFGVIWCIWTELFMISELGN